MAPGISSRPLKGPACAPCSDRVSVGIEFIDFPDNGVNYRVWIDDGSGAGIADDATLNGGERILRGS